MLEINACIVIVSDNKVGVFIASSNKITVETMQKPLHLAPDDSTTQKGFIFDEASRD